jgi:hypothetical protein
MASSNHYFDHSGNQRQKREPKPTPFRSASISVKLPTTVGAHATRSAEYSITALALSGS